MNINKANIDRHFPTPKKGLPTTAELMHEKIRKANEKRNAKLIEFEGKKYNLLTRYAIKELKKRNLEFTDENINLAIEIVLSVKYFARLANDDRTRIMNAVKRKYNSASNTRKGDFENGEQNARENR